MTKGIRDKQTLSIAEVDNIIISKIEDQADDKQDPIWQPVWDALSELHTLAMARTNQ